jgi:predicted nucleotidyltransferase
VGLANGHTGTYTGRMRSDLPALARDIGVPERTLRRAVQRGTVHCHRPGVRQVELASDERTYLRENWQTISTLTEALRTERNVRLAVLFGSMARGHAGPDSDIDVLVSLADDRSDAAVKLAVRLERTLGRSVDIARLERVDAQAPLLLDRVLDEGRVLVDRDGQWGLLRERHSAIRVRARRDHRRQMAGARRAIEELTQ